MASETISGAIEKNKVVIFSKPHCPYCAMAKEQFHKLNQEYAEIELDNCSDCQDARTALGQITGATSVPRVFINGKFIGGGSDVKEMYESGQLQKLLE